MARIERLLRNQFPLLQVLFPICEFSKIHKQTWSTCQGREGGRKEKWPPDNHNTKTAQGTEVQKCEPGCCSQLSDTFVFLRFYKVNGNQNCLGGSLTWWKSTLVCWIDHHMLILSVYPVCPKMLLDKCCDGGFGLITQQADVSLAKRSQCSEPGNAFLPLSI